MSEPLPALCLIAVPGRRRRTIELSQDTERPGFAGIYVPSPFANASLSHMGQSLAALPAAKRNDAGFFIGNMSPTCISDDMEAAKAVNRRTLTNYAFLPNYRNYWKEAGYVEEMDAIETAVAEGRRDDVAKYLSDKWLADNTLFGPAAKLPHALPARRPPPLPPPLPR